MPPKILFVHSSNETFVKLDRELLINSFELCDLYVPRKFPVSFGLYWRSVRKSDVIFCWFASWNSFWVILLAKIFRKPSIMVIGGYDVADLPEANYGHQRGGLKKKISQWAMGLADILIPFSEYSQSEAIKNAGVRADRMKVIYIGVPDLFVSLPATARERIALTVGKVEWANLKRKGLESFVRVAATLQDVKFILVGEWVDDSIEFLRSIAFANVTFTGRVDDGRLLEFYRHASIYVQPSLHEGFGLSVAEAMLAGCIPVITNAGSLPEVIGDCGFYCNTSEPFDIAKSIEIALASPSWFRGKCRERILSLFPMQKRRELLEESIYSILPLKK